jgi:hypothetical protein
MKICASLIKIHRCIFTGYCGAEDFTSIAQHHDLSNLSSKLKFPSIIVWFVCIYSVNIAFLE